MKRRSSPASSSRRSGRARSSTSSAPPSAATSCCSGMADERYITQAEADAAKAEADRHARRSRPAAGHRAVLRRGGAQASRAPVRREGAVRERPRGHGRRSMRGCRKLANQALEHGLRALRQAPRLAASRRATSSPRSHTIERFKDDRWNRPIAVGDVVPAVVVTAPKTGPARLRIGRYHARSRARKATPGRAATSAADLFKPGDLVEVGGHEDRRGDRRRDGHARSDADRRRRDRRDREPHRPDQGDGRRLELQPQQVQPRGAGVSPARIDLQADRLHRGDRSRLHADLDPRSTRRSAIRRATARSTARTTTITSSRGRSRCAGRSKSRATSRRSR